ncbi:hypothetical protein FSP39_008897 [Pinctada imbricata]|uniref:Uncharacterized protein n=1 Tax=Pinctada imbricata TaxID=66713 RepID=A0AA89BJ31_PINIB|nr:hypothetical protein FSP39_008897 [Pinctada imbricata]
MLMSVYFQNRRGRAPRVNVRRRKPKDGSQQLSGRASSSDDVIPRGKYESEEPDYDTGEMKRLRRYLEETELEMSFHKILGVLLDLPFLPYNPYPGFVRRFRAIAERYAMSKGIQDWEVLRILEIDLQKTLFHDLYLREDHSTEVYGLQTILQGVSPWHLSKYKWMVENVVPNTAALHSKEGYSNQVMVALVGRCVFEGVFYHNVHHVTLRAEHLITGPDSNEDEFISRIKEVVEAKQYVEMSCALRLQPEAPAFASATVEFCLNFIEVPDDIDKESTQETYCERPMGSLYDGVFLIRAHAEQYMAALSPILNKDADKIELKVKTSGRMVIDGLTIGGEEDNTGAFSPEIKDPNRKYFRQKLAELDIISDFSDALHYVILLALMEKKNNGDDLVIEAFRMAASSAGRMTGVMEYCKSLRYLVLGMGKQRDEWAAVREEFYRFISTIEETLIDKIHNITIDIKATGQRLQGCIRTILSTDEHAFALTFDVHKTSLLLESLELFCIPAVMVLAESVFDNTPKLKYMIDLHLDDLWHDQLVEFIEAEYFQPNPYPEFISRLREYAMKTDLFFERDSEILERMFATLLHLEDDKNYIYTIAGVDAYGVWSSLAVFDPVTIQAVLQLVQDKFQQTDFVKNKGPYRVGICLALVGSCIWYGKMDPYLNEVELHEHIYIQGPTGGYGQALDLFSEIVYDYVHKIVMENKMPVDGVYFDDVIRFRWEEMANQKSAFISKCLYYTNERKSVAMKTLETLEKIKHMLKQIQDTIAADVHSISPKAEEAMMRLESDGRPEVPKPRASPKPRSEGRRSVLSKISERTEDHLSDISENVQEKKTIIDLHYMDV